MSDEYEQKVTEVVQKFRDLGSSRTPNASASLWAVRGDAIRRSSSKFEIESAETPLLAESSWRVIRRSSRTLFRLWSSGMRHAYPFAPAPNA